MMKWFISILIQLCFTLFLYLIAILIIGLSLWPGIALCVKVWTHAASSAWNLRLLYLSFSLVSAYFITGICLIFLTGMIRILFRLSLQEGEYSLTSRGAFKWALTNSLMLVVWNVFGDFILLTPFVNLFYRLMGARLGKNVQINSKFGADLSLLEIGDNTVIGGHSTAIGHSVERGRLILKKVRIGSGVTVGLNSVILPGAVIGDKSIIAAGTVLGKNAQIGPREVVSGVPGISNKTRKEGQEKNS